MDSLASFLRYTLPVRDRLVLPSMHAPLLVLLLAGFSLLGCSTGQKSAAPPQDEKPSVILITLDTTRVDRLGCYGSDAGLTPFLDGLAARSTLFERCYSAVPLTLPSHASILSGWLPLRHGVRVNAEAGVPPGVPLLAEEFRNRGYSTGAFVSASVLLRRYGLDRGFGVYDDSFYNPRLKGYQKTTAGTTLPKALDWIRGQRGPFFCWIHLFDPHRPYAEVEPFSSDYRNRPYDGQIAYMDDQIASFWKSLSAIVDVDGVALAVCADHGEALGERGEEEHGVFLYENTVRVPLLLRLPRQRGPQRIAAPVGLVDIAPTLREVAHLPPQPVGDGRSLLPLVTGRAKGPRVLVSESLQGMLSFGWAPLYSAVEGNDKYILAPRQELFDLATDPGETKNLEAVNPSRATELRTALRNAQSTIPVPASAHPGKPLDSEELRQLASLGYLGGTATSSPISGRDPKEVITLVRPILDTSQFIGERKYAEAIALITPVLARDPKNPYAYFLLGQAYRPSDPPRAIAAWKRAVALSPSFHWAWAEWVRLLMDQGRAEEAARVATLALASCQDRTGALRMAVAYEQALSGIDPDALLSLASAALEMNPDLAPALLLRAEAHRRAGRNSDAGLDVRAALDLVGSGEPKWWAKDPVFGPALRAYRPLSKPSQ